MNTDNSLVGTFSENLIERSKLSTIRGGTGGVLRDEDILLPDPEPGDEDN